MTATSPQPPRYDFTAAGDLSYALAQLRAKLQDLASARTTGHARELGDPVTAPRPYYLWTGRERDTFEGDYRQQNANLLNLLDIFDTIQRRLQRATGDALRAKRLFDLEQRMS